MITDSSNARPLAPVTRATVACEAQADFVIRDRPLLVGRDRLILAFLVVTWLAATVVFWTWWARVEHIVSLPLFIVATVALAYDLTLMPLSFVFFLLQARRPDPVPAPDGLRVAMLTAIVPSAEAIEVLERTLTGMVHVRYPHDSWVLDEGGDPAVRELCAQLGAQYFTRKGRPEYNQPEWPFQARTKSGNYNAWFHEIGFARYDYFVQLDTDHVPEPSYLDEVLGYFQDPSVGYVALPSIYGNLSDWPSRGSSEQNQVFHGPIQMGYYGWARTPMIIGSHAAYRMAAVKEIGGFAKSRAEDHVDTLELANAGYTGVFLPKALAIGLGPQTLSDYLSQEHQWAFSMMQVLLKFGHNKGRLNRRQHAVFLFSEFWYCLFAGSYLMLWLLPLLALLTNIPTVHIALLQFVAYGFPLTLLSLVTLLWTYRRGWLKPGNHFILSWQGLILSAARWPVVLSALVSATVSVLFRHARFTYLVTPKGKSITSLKATLHNQLTVIIPATITALILLTYRLYHGGEANRVAGYAFFALFSAALFTAVFLVSTVTDLRRRGSSLSRRVGAYLAAWPRVGLGIVLLATVVGSGAANQSAILTALSYRPQPAPVARIASSESAQATPGTPAATPTGVAALQPLAPVSSRLFDPRAQGVTFGAYDPAGRITDLSRLDHLFMTWDIDAQGGIPVDRVRAQYAQGRPVMLSVEPWPLPGYPGDNLFPAIIDGSYDPVIRNQARTLKALQQPILIRFGHEMDLVGLYPWSGAIPSEYVAVYRHVVDTFRAEGATNVRWVWSPAGTSQTALYYPGDDYVDYVGTTVLEAEAWELEYAGVTEPRPFATLLRQKYDLLAPLGKPLILAETGIDLAGDQQIVRLREMVNVLPDFPLVRAVVYFNDVNAVNLHDPTRPDWALSDEEIAALKAALDASPLIERN